MRQQSFEAEKERLLKDMDYVKRNISGQNTIQAKGRLRRLSRIVEAIESLGFEAVQGKSWAKIVGDGGCLDAYDERGEVERRIRGLRGPSHRPPRLHLNLKASLRSGDLVLRTYDVAIGYADEGRPLFHVPDLVFKRTRVRRADRPERGGEDHLPEDHPGARCRRWRARCCWGRRWRSPTLPRRTKGWTAENTLVQEIEIGGAQYAAGGYPRPAGALPVQRRRRLPQSGRRCPAASGAGWRSPSSA